MQLHERRANLIAAHKSLTGFLYGLDTSMRRIWDGSSNPWENSNCNCRLHWSCNADGTSNKYWATIVFSARHLCCLHPLISLHFFPSEWKCVRSYVSRICNCHRWSRGLGQKIVSATSPNFASLVVARVISGVGFGQAMSVIVEIAPPELRGRSPSLLLTYIVIDLTVGYFLTFGSRNLQNGIAWRMPFIVQLAMTLNLCIGMTILTFSPRRLVQVGQKEEAQRVLENLRSSEVAEKELNEIETSISESSESSNARFMEMFECRYVRRTILGIVLMICLQMNGVVFRVLRWLLVAFD